MPTDTAESLIRELASYPFVRVLETFRPTTRVYCVICEGEWTRGKAECHEPDCLAMRARALVAPEVTP